MAAPLVVACFAAVVVALRHRRRHLQSASGSRPGAGVPGAAAPKYALLQDRTLAAQYAVTQQRAALAFDPTVWQAAASSPHLAPEPFLARQAQEARVPTSSFSVITSAEALAEFAKVLHGCSAVGA